ncbi:DUF4129 domain-containing protein [Mucilaginibacter sp. PPCGB 2223]|uniref:DUF4129 domain-containing protein n=1 Tax=Mucilaginibacter sp. PPCGB 2223 TaxID=1886027 RepID=UPI001112A0EC|nr:DUF4129 domain-containing protein [Mucilaginibacter sp. PPCGB 2223]
MTLHLKNTDNMPKPVLIILLLLFSYGAYCGPKPQKTAPHAQQVLHIDTEKVNLHNFDSTALKRYARDKDFQYDNAKLSGESLWTRFWRWLWGRLGDIFGNSFNGGRIFTIVEYVLIIAAIGFLIYVVLKMAGIDVMQVFRGASKKIEIPYAESLENIHEINFDEEIEHAVNNRNYRLAIRLLYLRSLKQLNDAQLIHWQLEKTNAAYINELTSDELRRSFSLLTRQFEYAWYGNFLIDGNAFQNISILFQDFKRMMI